MKTLNPQGIDDMLLYRLGRVLGTAGSLITRICEGEFGITRRGVKLAGLLVFITDVHALSLQTAQEVYGTWALPGGVRAEDWWITASVRAFLTSTDMGEVKDPSASVALEPAASLVKGTDGPDWTVVCVLAKVTATYKQEAQIAFAHCERMQWVGGRWMIAPGAPPAPAPATWPGTALANQAGWRDWSTGTSSYAGDEQ